MELKPTRALCLFPITLSLELGALTTLSLTKRMIFLFSCFSSSFQKNHSWVFSNPSQNSSIRRMIPFYEPVFLLLHLKVTQIFLRIFVVLYAKGYLETLSLRSRIELKILLPFFSHIDRAFQEMITKNHSKKNHALFLSLHLRSLIVFSKIFFASYKKNPDSLLLSCSPMIKTAVRIAFFAGEKIAAHFIRNFQKFLPYV